MATKASPREMFGMVVQVKAARAPGAAQVTKKSGQFVVPLACMIKLHM